MIKLIMSLFTIFFTTGLYFIAADLLNIPTLQTSRAMSCVAHRQKRSVKNIDVWLELLAVRLSKYIKMDEYKRLRVSKKLQAAQITQSPEMYTAQAVTKAAAVLLLAIPCLYIFPILALIIVILAVLIYFREIRRPDNILKEKMDGVEVELPRFAATIEQELDSNRDVLSMLESYKKYAGKAFRQELDITTADMRSSSYEAALVRFEARLNSPKLSDVIRGLIGILRGDDGRMYFKMLSHDFKQLELQRLKGEAQKVPPKMKVLSFVMLACFILTYFVIMGVQILSAIGTMF